MHCVYTVCSPIMERHRDVKDRLALVPPGAEQEMLSTKDVLTSSMNMIICLMLLHYIIAQYVKFKAKAR